ncbi:hypothetical protein OKW28_000997 [Paraburkholderia sp. 40]
MVTAHAENSERNAHTDLRVLSGTLRKCHAADVDNRPFIAMVRPFRTLVSNQSPYRGRNAFRQSDDSQL